MCCLFILLSLVCFWLSVCVCFFCGWLIGSCLSLLVLLKVDFFFVVVCVICKFLFEVKCCIEDEVLMVVVVYVGYCCEVYC